MDALIAVIEDLRDKLDFGWLQGVVSSMQSLSTVALTLTSFTRDLVHAAGSTNPDTVPDVIRALFEDLLQHLVVLYVGRSPATYATLELLGLEQAVTALSTGGDEPLLSRAPVPKPRLALDALANLLVDPVDHLKTRLGAQRLASQQVAEQVTRNVFGPLLDLVTMAGGSGVVGIGAVEPDQPDPGDLEARRRATLLVSLPSVDVGGDLVSSQIAVVVDLVHAGGTSRTGDAGPGFLISPEGTLQVSALVPGAQFDLTLSGGAFSAFLPADDPPVLHGAADDVSLRIGFETVPPADGTPTIVLEADTLGLTIGGVRASTEAA